VRQQRKDHRQKQQIPAILKSNQMGLNLETQLIDTNHGPTISDPDDLTDCGILYEHLHGSSSYDKRISRPHAA
jgi:hypothetical protein